MFPVKNIKAFLKANYKGDFFGYNPYNLSEIYACFIQAKINTNLKLLTNPDLIRKFDLDYDTIHSEILDNISSLELGTDFPARFLKNPFDLAFLERINSSAK